jgi:penicillin amidase
VLEAGSRATPEAMAQLQIDVQSIPARRVLRQLQGLEAANPSVGRALALLRGWDAGLRADSPAAALFEIWARGPLPRVVMEGWVDDPATLEAVLDEDSLYDVFEGSSVEVWLRRLEEPAAWRSRALRDAALRSSLAEAVIETEARLGPDWERWSWGRLHRAELRHPLSPLLEPGQRARVDLGPQPRPGSGDTVNSAGYRLGDFRQRWGAPFRILLDVGAWDEARVVSAPGQSGDLASPHYRDLFEVWGRDATVPLLYGRERIEEAAERRILLRPGGPS